jgi:arsenate reductase
MSAAFFNKYADSSKARAISAGTHPADRVHPEVIDAMREVGIDVSAAQPQKLTLELAQGADLLITMGCGDECPFVPGLKRDDWPLPDPKGKGIEQVRQIRDEVERRVLLLINSNQVGGQSEQERQAALDRLSRHAYELGLYERNVLPEGGRDE